jgi:hypothetical protein
MKYAAMILGLLLLAGGTDTASWMWSLTLLVLGLLLFGAGVLYALEEEDCV